jgi:hypothetical protein
MVFSTLKSIHEKLNDGPELGLWFGDLSVDNLDWLVDQVPDQVFHCFASLSYAVTFQAG